LESGPWRRKREQLTHLLFEKRKKKEKMEGQEAIPSVNGRKRGECNFLIRKGGKKEGAGGLEEEKARSHRRVEKKKKKGKFRFNIILTFSVQRGKKKEAWKKKGEGGGAP